ncbi:hypothetical protein [Cylindrospermum sp. FACHB-282]|uniref:hypothetical protein n=1 Tax=Cylindrospermum sp. FACHB-282 TaxID=2692794 RepID=UPI00199ED276|nr:hypothetical protein [Cylindrospermum sp. FACHB-282]MBD2384028.1 hypothetical protein [Cylindrospermum sp. FACHB-282]
MWSTVEEKQAVPVLIRTPISEMIQMGMEVDQVFVCNTRYIIQPASDACGGIQTGNADSCSLGLLHSQWLWQKV